VLCGATGGFLAWNQSRQIEGNTLVEHTTEVLNHIERLQGLFVDAETGQRGYLVTGQELYLDPYLRATRTWRTEWQLLQRLTADSPRQGSD